MEIRLGESDFTVGRIPARKRLRLLHRIARLLAPALGSAAGAAVAAGGLRKADFDLGGMVEGVLAKLDEEETDHLFRELLASTYLRKGDKQVLVMDVFDVVFEENLSDFPRLVKAALEVNYASFFSDVRAALEEAAERARASKSGG